MIDCASSLPHFSFFFQDSGLKDSLLEPFHLCMDHNVLYFVFHFRQITVRHVDSDSLLQNVLSAMVIHDGDSDDPKETREERNEIGTTKQQHNLLHQSSSSSHSPSPPLCAAPPVSLNFLLPLRDNLHSHIEP